MYIKHVLQIHNNIRHRLFLLTASITAYCVHTDDTSLSVQALESFFQFSSNPKLVYITLHALLFWSNTRIVIIHMHCLLRLLLRLVYLYSIYICVRRCSDSTRSRVCIYVIHVFYKIFSRRIKKGKKK